MSNYAESGGDDQSEDGELRHSPPEVKAKQEEILDFSLSDEDVDTADSLDIKPPQAATSNRVPRTNIRSSKRRERREARNRHSRVERHRAGAAEERAHYRVEKHHRERNRDRVQYHREYHKELYRYSAENVAPSSSQYFRQDELVVNMPQAPPPNMRYERKYDEKRHEKYRYEEKHRLKSVADQTLDDLRERLLDKKRLKDASDVRHSQEKESRRRLRAVEHLEADVPMEHDAEMYVKEIIDLSENKHHKKDDPKDPESEEQVLRREKLLQADREIARQKEQYKLERARRHQRRLERQQAKLKLLKEQRKDQEEKRAKRLQMSGELGQYKDKDLSVVTVSDASSSGSNSAAGESPKQSSSDERTSSDEEEQHSEESTSADGEEEQQTEPEQPVYHSDEEEDNKLWKELKDSPELIKSEASKSPPQSPVNEPKPEEKSPETKPLDAALPPYFPAIQGCRSVEEFQCLNRIEEGTYGVVYRARDKRTEEIVALKRLKMEKEKEGFPITSLREINTLLKGQHPNIVTVREIVVGSNMDKIFIVMDYVEHDLKSLMETMRNRRQVFVPGEVKCLLKQLLGAVAHLHDNWILHRDLKTSNLLLSHKGILKVGDFGLAREYGSPLKAYTPIVVTLWYRAPELLLCAKEYSTPVDIWSVGCIFAELLLMNALFPGKSEVDQLNRIFKELGTPNDKVWPTWSSLPAVKKMKFTEYQGASLQQKFSMLSEAGLGLLRRLLTYDPAQRSTAEDGMRHPWFSEAPLPIDPAMFPTWPAKSELGRKALQSPKPPSGGKEYKQLGDADEDSALGFHMGNTAASSSMMEARRLAMGAGFSLKF